MTDITASTSMDRTLRRLTESIKVLEEDARGISPEEYKAFLFIAGRPDASAKDVQEHMQCPQSSASRMLSKLSGEPPAGLGLVTSMIDPLNRRRVKLGITERGLRLLGRLAVITGALMACSVDDFTTDPPQSLARNYYLGSIANEATDRKHYGLPRITMLDPDTV